jgi:hypothetical protein
VRGIVGTDWYQLVADEVWSLSAVELLGSIGVARGVGSLVLVWFS